MHNNAYEINNRSRLNLFLHIASWARILRINSSPSNGLIYTRHDKCVEFKQHSATLVL